MTYLLCVILVAIAAVFVVVGSATVTAGPYIVAAALSATAIVLLWRRVKGKQEKPFVTEPPAVVAPDWTKPIHREPIAVPVDVREDEEVVELPPVSIVGYDDLVAAEVLPSLETLSVDELQVVILHERSGMGRQAIIHRAETLIDLTLGAGSADRLTGVPVTATAEPEKPTRGRRLRKEKSKDADESDTFFADLQKAVQADEEPLGPREKSAENDDA